MSDIQLDIALELPSVFLDTVRLIFSSYTKDFEKSILHPEDEVCYVKSITFSYSEYEQLEQDLVHADIPFTMFQYYMDGQDMLEYFRPASFYWPQVHHALPMRDGQGIVSVESLQKILRNPRTLEYELRRLVEPYYRQPDLHFWSKYPFQHLLKDDEEPHLISNLSILPSLASDNIQIVQCTSCHRFYRFEPNNPNKQFRHDILHHNRLFAYEDTQLVNLPRKTPCMSCSPDSLKLVAYLDPSGVDQDS